MRLLAFRVPEKSQTKDLILAFMERRKSERTNEQKKHRSPIVSYSIKVIITALYTKSEASSFYSFREIFDEKFNIGPYGEKEE